MGSQNQTWLSTHAQWSAYWLLPSFNLHGKFCNCHNTWQHIRICGYLSYSPHLTFLGTSQFLFTSFKNKTRIVVYHAYISFLKTGNVSLRFSSWINLGRYWQIAGAKQMFVELNLKVDYKSRKNLPITVISKGNEPHIYYIFICI